MIVEIVGVIIYLLIGLGAAARIYEEKDRSQLFALGWGLCWPILVPINVGAFIVAFGKWKA